MRILHILPTRSKEYGGPVSVAEAIAEESFRQGVECAIYPPQSGKSGKSIQALWSAVRRADVVHIHGLWNLNATLAARLARWSGIPYIITPHGMLDHWALSRSRFKKQVYGFLFERTNLRKAAEVHFLNSEECSEAMSYGEQLNTFVLPNGVFTDRFKSLPYKTKLSKSYPELDGAVTALFLGRLHPKKGFDLLIPAFVQAIRSCPLLHLLVVGPDQRGYRGELEAQIREQDLHSRVTFLGMVSGERKLEVLAAADFFVLPSYQEGDSIAVKEAMASGLPVLITSACHFPEIEIFGAGMVLPYDAISWANAMSTLYSDKRYRTDMGHSGSRLVSNRYTWQKVTRQLLDVYRRVSIEQPKELHRGD